MVITATTSDKSFEIQYVIKLYIYIIKKLNCYLEEGDKTIVNKNSTFIFKMNEYE